MSSRSRAQLLEGPYDAYQSAAPRQRTVPPHAANSTPTYSTNAPAVVRSLPRLSPLRDDNNFSAIAPKNCHAPHDVIPIKSAALGGTLRCLSIGSAAAKNGSTACSEQYSHLQHQRSGCRKVPPVAFAARGMTTTLAPSRPKTAAPPTMSSRSRAQLLEGPYDD